MRVILDLIEEPDLSTIILMVLLYLVGKAMTYELYETQRRANRLSAAAFIIYGLYGLIVFVPQTAEELVWITLRSLIAGGLAYGSSCIALAVWHYVHQFIVTRVRARLQQPVAPLTPYLPPPVRPAAPTAVAGPRRPLRQRVRDFVRDEKARLDDRVDAIEELKVADIFAEEQLKELAGHELEEFVRRVSDKFRREPD